jgi:acetylornithine deacetylase/succinyl-diaminopimelate desuccinylase-like protein
VRALWARVTVHGHGAHAGRTTRAQTAALKAMRVVQAIGEIEDRANRDEDRHPQFAAVAHPLNPTSV